MKNKYIKCGQIKNKYKMWFSLKMNKSFIDLSSLLINRQTI